MTSPPGSGTAMAHAPMTCPGRLRLLRERRPAPGLIGHGYPAQRRLEGRHSRDPRGSGRAASLALNHSMPCAMTASSHESLGVGPPPSAQLLWGVCTVRCVTGRRGGRESLTAEHLIHPCRRGEREALRVLPTTRKGAVTSCTAAVDLGCRATTARRSAPTRPTGRVALRVGARGSALRVTVRAAGWSSWSDRARSAHAIAW